MLNSHICGLDISSSRISAVLAKLKGRRISKLFFESGVCKGVKRGSVVNSVDLIGCLSDFLKGLKEKTGVNIRNIYANISGQDIVARHSRATIPLAERGNRVVNQADIDKVNEQARILGASLEDEILHFIPYGYSIDSKDNLSNPLGLYSHRLESDLFLICAKMPSLQNFNRSFNQAGYQLKGIFFSGLASSAALMRGELKRGTNVICDIGSDVSELLVFKDGSLRNIDILNFGGDDLTSQLADSLNINFALAEDVKKSHASVGDYSQIKEDKEILIKKNDLYKPIKQKIVAEIVTSRAFFICQEIKSRLNNIVASSEVNNFIAIGGCVLLEGFLELLENSVEIPVRLGRLSHPQLLSLSADYPQLSGQKYVNYLTSLGLISKAIDDHPPGIASAACAYRNPLAKVLHKVREVYQEYF